MVNAENMLVNNYYIEGVGGWVMVGLLFILTHTLNSQKSVPELLAYSRD
jgi:hypothetical protein